jgi:hypothetical protein
LVRRAIQGIGALVLGMALVVASLGVGTAGPHSALCALTKKVATAEAKVNTAINEAIGSGDWPKGQAALVAALTKEGALEKEVAAAMGGASKAVRRAQTVWIGLLRTELEVAKRAASVLEYEEEADVYTDMEKIYEAQNTLDKYFGAHCVA